MGQGPALSRRALLASAALATAGCARDAQPLPPARWTGASAERGHRLRSAEGPAWPTETRRAHVLVLGGGIAGLAAARGLLRQGLDDLQLLELEDSAGGNARGHAIDGIACPQGAHYLPLPPPEAHEVREWLHEIGLLRHEFGREVADERHLAHSPQERLFFEGRWIEGLLAPAEPGSRRLAQYQQFARLVAALQRRAVSGAGAQRSFALPAHRSAWGETQATLDRQTMAQWLAAQGLDEPALLAYLDYACRDDYGAGIDTVSAWAGMHYFASRHGFGAPGDVEGERDAVFTWPEGNAWLAQRLAAPLGARLHGGRSVLQVREARHHVEVLAWNEQAQAPERWQAGAVVLALPLFISARVLQDPPAALREAAALLTYAPWLVANLLLDRPPYDRPGAAPAWDNVVHRAPGSSTGLGYVDARHQGLAQSRGATVLTAYHALPAAQRSALLNDSASTWAERMLADLHEAHPDLRERVQRVELTRWGHAMAVPRPGVQRHPALAALRAGRGRIRFAHGDLAGYSVFEEAFTAGIEAAAAVGAGLR